MSAYPAEWISLDQWRKLINTTYPRNVRVDNAKQMAMIINMIRAGGYLIEKKVSSRKFDGGASSAVRYYRWSEENKEVGVPGVTK